jgi:simple sugar transport system substrate-binding protein
MLLAGVNPGQSVIVPPTLITQAFLIEQDIKNMGDLGAKMPQFQHADVAMPAWMPQPQR